MRPEFGREKRKAEPHKEKLVNPFDQASNNHLKTTKWMNVINVINRKDQIS